MGIKVPLDPKNKHAPWTNLLNIVDCHINDSILNESQISNYCKIKNRKNICDVCNFLGSTY